MIWAHTETGPSRAQPGLRGRCPDCRTEVIAKCGELVTWHWAHLPSDQPCGFHGETEWHLGWKEWALERGCEVEKVVVPGFRADIVSPTGWVTELQSKGLEAEKVWAREEAYAGHLSWIAQVAAEQADRVRFKDHGENYGVHYSRGPKWLSLPEAPLYLDIDGALWLVKLRLKDVQTEWGDSERLLGRAWEAAAEHALRIPLPRKEYKFCKEHGSWFCECVYPWLYQARR